MKIPVSKATQRAIARSVRRSEIEELARDKGQCLKREDGRYWTCDYCRNIWSDMLQGTGWRPHLCPERPAHAPTDDRS